MFHPWQQSRFGWGRRDVLVRISLLGNQRTHSLVFFPHPSATLPFPPQPSFVPTEHLLLFNNTDKPGTVARITGILSDANINIASFLVARQHPGSPALSVVVCDGRIPSSVAAKIGAVDGIFGVRTASFGSAYATPPRAEATA